MQRSSSSIGGLAAALAKAQAELVNPEKSLVGSVHPDGPAGGGAHFSLCAALGGARHCPQDARPARNCRGADHRDRSDRRHRQSHNGLGARQRRMDRLGLAGLRDQRDGDAASDGSGADLRPPLCSLYTSRNCREDDLDAPDLVTSDEFDVAAREAAAERKGSTQRQSTKTRSRPTVHRNARTQSQISTPILEAEPSAGLRDRLIAELTGLGSSDDAAMWAHRCLGEKNRLTAADARKSRRPSKREW